MAYKINNLDADHHFYLEVDLDGDLCLRCDYKGNDGILLYIDSEDGSLRLCSGNDDLGLNTNADGQLVVSE